MNHAEIKLGHMGAEEIRPSKKRSEGLGVDQEKLRIFNRQLILSYLRKNGPASRASLANNLGFSRSTVSSIVNELMEEDLVEEGEKLQSRAKGGKRATEVHFKVDAGYIISIDLGWTHLRIYLTNLAATILDRYESRFGMQHDWQEVLPYIADQVRNLLIKHRKNPDQVWGIGFGIPGLPDPASGRLTWPPLTCWTDVDIPGYLRDSLILPKNCPIYLDNDANLGALGENRYGEGRGVTHLIYIKLSTGIGAGLILNGQLYRGSSGVAGEFGHVFVEDIGSPCPSCGRRGCLEALAGLRAIVHDAHYHSSSERIRSQKLVDITPEHLSDVIIEAQMGDVACQTALERAGKRIGTAIGDLINVYNPSLILLDGGIIRPGQGNNVLINELLLVSLRRSAKEVSLPAAWQGMEILTGKLGDDAVGLGAVAMVLDRDETLKMPNDDTPKLLSKAP